MCKINNENPRCSYHQGEQKIPCKVCFAYLHNSKNNDCCQPIPLYSFSGKKVAAVWGDVIVKKVKWSKHFLRRYQAWCCDVDVLFAAKNSGAKFVHIWETEKDTIYQTTINDFIEKGIDINYGYGDQKALSFPFWTIVEPK